jgi:phage baseplate assembly protein W
MATEKIYKDLDLEFSPNPLTGDVPKKTGSDAIKQSLKNILLYNIYEKPYNTRFDVGVRYLLFENKGSGFAEFLKVRIKVLLETYEPRIILNDVIVKGNMDNNSLTITIYFTPKETQTTDTLELFLGKYNG